ncbi:MAG: hypothetical protein LBR26_12585 [Prevotella sp.]|jgi:hypothetical protein|nr:hypothetical protein [Prevotella sp.]
MEAWPINSAACQREQNIRFPLVINQDCICVWELPCPQIHSIQWLLFPATGYRESANGALVNAGYDGHSYSSSPNAATAYYLSFRGNNVGLIFNLSRAYGLTVRCVKEFIPVFLYFQ